MTTQPEFWKNIGPTCDGGETLPRFLSTPNATRFGSNRNYKDNTNPQGEPTDYRPSLDTLANSGELTSFVVASLAKTYRSPGKEQASMENAQDYGTSSPVSFANFDQDTCLWKTSQLCLFGGLMPFSGRWPRSGTMRSGIAYRLPPLVPRISGTGSSLWRTPQAWNAQQGPKSDANLQKAMKTGHAPITLTDQVRTVSGGQLNPTWVELLMGFPPGWTVVEG